MFFIDANNLLGDMGRDRTPQNIDYLLSYLKKYGGKRKMRVVFDGNPPCDPSRFPSAPNITVDWQDPGTYRDADEMIVSLLSRRGNNSDVTLITRDVELSFLSKNEGVTTVISPTEFRNLLERRPSRSNKNSSDHDGAEKKAAWASVDTDAINAELLAEFTKLAKEQGRD